jgi:hypothetical protein
MFGITTVKDHGIQDLGHVGELNSDGRVTWFLLPLGAWQHSRVALDPDYLTHSLDKVVAADDREKVAASDYLASWIPS